VDRDEEQAHVGPNQKMSRANLAGSGSKPSRQVQGVPGVATCNRTAGKPSIRVLWAAG
jgi:hypothetical protein